MNNPFSGDAQNLQAYNGAQINAKDRLQDELQQLQEKQARLTKQIYSQEAQDEEAMKEFDQVKQEIIDLKQHMKARGLEGGRRKRHRRTKRKSKSRAAKRRAAKSRRSKH